MILTNDEQIAYKARSLRVHGMNGGYYYEDIGYTARLDELQAAILRVKMRYLHDWTERRRYHATLYRALLADAPLQLPAVRPYNYHVYHQFTVRTTQRDALREFLRERGVESAVYYPLPLHLQPAYRFLGYCEGDCPHAERAAQEVLSLPIHSELTEDQIAQVAHSVLGIRTDGRQSPYESDDPGGGGRLALRPPHPRLAEADGSHRESPRHGTPHQPAQAAQLH
jgi:dTDP-4-amino-4,6-dideoxygalactose transaminase